MAAEADAVAFKVTFKRDVHEFELPLSTTVAALKVLLQEKTGILPDMQKLSFKGKLNDEKTLEESKIKKGSKILLIGSTKADVLNAGVVAETAATLQGDKMDAMTKEKIQTEPMHKKVIANGVPDDAEPVQAFPAPLPAGAIKGILNKYKKKVRVNFDAMGARVMISSSDNSHSISMGSITAVNSEALDDHPGYSILVRHEAWRYHDVQHDMM
uniref:Ubiquitin-like domain-containing protein n=2 Tax=Palpitomonas bilix TaxID=652834 RepID=A0A7S3FZW0_9EUKA|mmetsp:Transcript_14474/g.36894  ORF Transcript_14474/g.36894 Transcript_14474/m.36894 type:complete len:213 (+) Transcript_14474:80-718(+)